MKNLLKTFLATAFVVPAITVVDAAPVSSCSKSGLTFGINIKGSKNKFEFEKNPTLIRRDERFKTFIIEQSKKNKETFNQERQALAAEKQANNVQFVNDVLRNVTYQNAAWAAATDITQAKDADLTDGRQMVKSHGFSHLKITSKKTYVDQNGWVVPAGHAPGQNDHVVPSACVGRADVASYAADQDDIEFLVPVATTTLHQILLAGQADNNIYSLRKIDIPNTDENNDLKNVSHIYNSNTNGVTDNTVKIDAETTNLLHTDDGTLFGDNASVNYMVYDKATLDSNGYTVFGVLAGFGVKPACVESLEGIFNETVDPNNDGNLVTRAVLATKDAVAHTSDLGDSFEKFSNSDKFVENMNAIAKAGKVGELNLGDTKGEYNPFSGMSLGLEVNVEYGLRLGDIRVAFGGIIDIPAFKKTAEIKDSGVAEANENNKDKENNNDNKDNSDKTNESTSNDYGLSITSKPSFGLDVNVLYNITQRLSIGGGFTAWYKRYDIKTNKMADLYLADESIWDGKLVSQLKEISKIDLDGYNKDIKDTGIANESISAKAWIFEPYIKGKYDITDNFGLTFKIGLPLKKKIMKTGANTLGDIPVSGFTASFGFSYTI